MKMEGENLTPEQAQAEWNSMAAARDDSEGISFKAETPPATPEVKPEEPKTEPVEEPTQVDPYEGLPVAAREKLQNFDQLVLQNQQLAQQLKEFAGRVSSLQSEFAKSRQATPAGQGPNQTQIAAAAKDPEKWEALKKDFPEWGEGIEAFVSSRLGQLAGQGMTAEQVEQVIAQRTSDAVAQTRGEMQELMVDLRHEGWRDLVKTPDFAQWHAAQKPEVQALANSDKAANAIRMLDLFKKDKAKPAANVRQERQSRLEAAVTTKSGAPAAVKTFEDMSPQEQWDYLARQRDSQA
jgi:hypothetical protein